MSALTEAGYGRLLPITRRTLPPLRPWPFVLQTLIVRPQPIPHQSKTNQHSTVANDFKKAFEDAQKSNSELAPKPDASKEPESAPAETKAEGEEGETKEDAKEETKEETKAE